jgi:hypothetical protein
VGVRTLLKEVNKAAKSPAALTYLAQILKEYGAMKEAIELYTLACTQR